MCDLFLSVTLSVSSGVRAVGDFVAGFATSSRRPPSPFFDHLARNHQLDHIQDTAQLTA